MAELTVNFVGPAAALVYLIPTVVWLLIADDALRFRLNFRPRSRLYHITPLCAGAATAFYALHIPISLYLTMGTATPPPRWFDLTDVALVVGLSSFRHLAWHLRPSASSPSRSWLATNYGLAALVGVVNLFPELIPTSPLSAQYDIARGLVIPFALLMLLLSVKQLAGFALPGRWRPGSNEIRRADVVAITIAMGGFLLLVGYYGVTDFYRQSEALTFVPVPPALSAAIGLLLAMPFGARLLGDLTRRFLQITASLGLTAIAFASFLPLRDRIPEALQNSTSFAFIGLLILAQLYVHPWLQAGIEHVLFRRSMRRRAELQEALHAISPELGVNECVARTLEALVRVMRLRGAALLLTRGRGTVVRGRIHVGALEQVWNKGAIVQSFPEIPFASGMFRELPREVEIALSRSGVVGGAPVISPRQDWGIAVATTGPLGTSFAGEDGETMQRIVEQLALLLDAAELLERAVRVERSLAHNEKLAAIGELAARVAHEIRNPVTAARSLAQLMVREPTSPMNAEHAELILTELERVEHQIADLLRFSRREELSLEPLTLDVLVKETVEELRFRLSEADIEVEVRSSEALMIEADREKLRHVLINLIENSIDALHDEAGKRQLSFDLRREKAFLRLIVADSGPGVDDSALPQLFEPFFSQKSNGTGLGLAIVKRTVEAHGGAVGALHNQPTGLLVTIDLPIAPEEAP